MNPVLLDLIPVSLAEIQRWLEWAGRQLLALETSRIRPGMYRSMWPNYPDEAATAYGYTGESLRPTRATAAEISLMDEILTLITLIPNPRQRQILNARLLVNPINGRYLYSWSKISILLHTYPRFVKREWEKGIESLLSQIPLRQVISIRERLESKDSFRDLAHH